MVIKEIKNKQDERRWLNLPSVIYKNDANWIPHIRQDIQSIFNPKKNKLFKDGDAKRWLLIDSSEQPIGRIAAFYSKKYSEGQKQRTGGLGFFECIEDEKAAKTLLQTACDWLESIGMEAVDGPINFGEKEAYWGLLVENFTDMSSFRMNYNPPYYQQYFENFGFQIFYNQLCYRRDMYIPIQEIFDRKSRVLLSSDEYHVSSMRGKNNEHIAHDFVTVYNAAWAGNFGFKQMKLQQARNIIKAMKPLMDKEILVFAYHKKKPIGFFINLPEANEFMRHVHGNLNVVGILKFLFHKWFSKRKTMVGLVFGVDRDYHGKGVEAAMIKFAEEKVITLNRYQETILTWVGDFNPKMIRVVENLGAQPYRKLITYRKILNNNLKFERHPIL